MLASNQPYQKVDDGIGAGLIGGAVVGGAMTGGVHAFGRKRIAGMRRDARAAGVDMAGQRMNEMLTKGIDSPEFKASTKVLEHVDSLDKKLKTAGQYHKKAFGGWKGKAASYGASMLAGAAVGGVGDAII